MRTAYARGNLDVKKKVQTYLNGEVTDITHMEGEECILSTEIKKEMHIKSNFPKAILVASMNNGVLLTFVLTFIATMLYMAATS